MVNTSNEQSRLCAGGRRNLAGGLPQGFNGQKYLATGKAASVKEAAQLAGISRSAYYKYKDAIFEYGTSASDEVATVKARLQDSAGVLSSFIGAISRVGAMCSP